jgi:hypothetical protein
VLLKVKAAIETHAKGESCRRNPRVINNNYVAIHSRSVQDETMSGLAARHMIRALWALMHELEEEIEEEARKEEEAGRRERERLVPSGVACNDGQKKARAKLQTAHGEQAKRSRGKQDGATKEESTSREVCTGARVLVKVRDRYYGRHGTVMGKKGNYFWNINLDAAAGEPACVIYKKSTSLVVVE